MNGFRTRRFGWDESYEDAQQRVQRLLDCLARLQVELPAGSRLKRFTAILGRFGNPSYNPLRDPEFDPVAISEGQRDYSEIALICEQLGERFPEKLASLLPSILSGSLLPSSDARTRARDLQFELWLAAQLIQAGFEVTLEEPDIVFVLSGQNYGIAAKRISSATQISKRVRKAVKQLQHARLRGLVALSFDRLVSPGDPRIISGTPEALHNAAEQLLREQLRIHVSQIQPLLPGTPAVGLIASLTVPAIVGLPSHVGVAGALVVLTDTIDYDQADPLSWEFARRLMGPS